MKTFFKQLETYEGWANGLVLNALRGIDPSVADKPRRRLCHVIGAQRVWLARVQERGWEPGWVWPDEPLDRCEERLEEIVRGWREVFSGVDETTLDRAVRYENTRSERFQSSLRDILTHLAIHGSFHRGQIAADLRAAGIDPPETDYIVYVR